MTGIVNKTSSEADAGRVYINWVAPSLPLFFMSMVLQSLSLQVGYIVLVVADSAVDLIVFSALVLGWAKDAPVDDVVRRLGNLQHARASDQIRDLLMFFVQTKACQTFLTHGFLRFKRNENVCVATGHRYRVAIRAEHITGAVCVGVLGVCESNQRRRRSQFQCCANHHLSPRHCWWCAWLLHHFLRIPLLGRQAVRIILGSLSMHKHLALRSLHTGVHWLPSRQRYCCGLCVWR